MKCRVAIFGVIFLFSAVTVYSQPTTSETIEKISRDMSKVAVSVDELNKQWKKFFETFSSNQGLRLSEKQQKILFAFEILNRSEQRLSTLQTLKVSLAERQSAARLTLARINDDLLPESVDRYVSLRGTTDAEQLRQMRRQTLEKEKYEMTKLISEIEISLNQINNEIRQIESLLRTIREKLFGEINNELSNL